ncbi:mRNA splicing protein [Friedmanniomyces endolithicus]|uniref:Pre-mRNA-processing protein 45 n=1 Tax=Friedmanniomyces endolithicus TaxID=329885 RepID=A0AAN6KWB7_9PEZI|nr:mRNA splicing protein [Friedmanniomyces endolithicus]KAK0885081.1 mRNA splicing protein [Friedmanniomyces endolithicus]KAK0901975.1 mRNA splicing protein [Friedmanniomyces endolithicus]KAK0922881.1 mRNA splicing protein [Friedmanniomyces endolithicus]KAK0998484.1 mRNA splicing protein [Friedmanniomyces endolithicus]
MAVTGSRFSLSSALPKPKYTGEDEELPTHTQQKGPRVVDARELESSQLVVKRSGPPPYGQRSGWRPRNPEDFGDGGAFPEIPVAQYPLDMGKKGAASSSNALAIQVDGEGKVKYDAIARRGHSDTRVIHASFKDLIPLRQRADAGEINMERPSAGEEQASKERTQKALQSLVDGTLAAQKPKNVKGTSRPEPTFVRYTPANQMGDNSKQQDRIMKIVQRQQDPMEPPKHKVKKIPRGPPSPPPPIMHSPPRKLTAEDQEAWRIPPPVSNWKNPKGYTVPLDKRLAADGRGLQDVTINDKFAQFAEALHTADRHAREEVQQRQRMQQRLAEKEKEAKEEHLRMLAQKARQDREAAISGRRPSTHDARSRSRSVDSRSSYSGSSRSPSPDQNTDLRDRERQRAERRQAAQRELRQKNMGHERRIQMLAREQNRDVSEKVALGLAKPTQSKETMYDSRLFNQTSGFSAGFNEDNHYDKPLFAERDALNSIYRPNVGDEDEEGEDGGETMDKIQSTKRFDVLGRAPKEGFKGTDTTEARSGPVQFERDRGDDPFGVDAMIAEAAKGASAKRKAEEDSDAKGKRARKTRLHGALILDSEQRFRDHKMPLRKPSVNDDRQPWELANPASISSSTAAPWRDSRKGAGTATKARRPNPQKPTDERKGIPSKYLQPARLPSTMKNFEIGSASDFMTLTMVQRPATATQSGETPGEVVAQSMAAHSQASGHTAKMRGDELPELPGWLIGLLAGLLSFGLIVAVVLYLANFPPEWGWLRRLRIHTTPQRRKKGGYVKLGDEDDSSADEKRGRRKLALRSPEAVGLGIFYTSSTAGGGGGLASRRRKNLSVDTSGRYGGLGTTVPGSHHDVAAGRGEAEAREWRSRAYDEEKLRHWEPPPLSPARFAWEALTAPIPSLAGFSALLGGGNRGREAAQAKSTTGGLSNERGTVLETGRYSPCCEPEVETEAFCTPAGVAVVAPRGANVFGKIGESVEHAAATLGGLLSDVVDRSAEEGLLLPVRDSERERGHEPALRAVV